MAALFVAEYIKDFNGTQAAIRAGYSAKSAAQQASRLLTNAKIAEMIAAAIKARTERVEIDADWLLNRLKQEAIADIAEIYGDDGELLPVSEWPLIFRQGLVAGIDVEEIFEGTGKDRVKIGEMKKVRLSDRAKRLEMIGKHVGVSAFKDRVEHTVSDPLVALFQQIAGQGIKPRADDDGSPAR